MAQINETDKIVQEESEVIDIAPDLVETKKGSELFGNGGNGLGEEYGVGISNIARPYQSPNFKAGVSGWRLNSNGIIQAVGVEISGDITISGGEIVAVSSGGTGANTLTGILKGNGTSAFTAIVPLSGTNVYYVSDSSGGAVTRKLTFTNGVLTSQT